MTDAPLSAEEVVRLLNTMADEYARLIGMLGSRASRMSPEAETRAATFTLRTLARDYPALVADRERLVLRDDEARAREQRLRLERDEANCLLTAMRREYQEIRAALGLPWDTTYEQVRAYALSVRRTPSPESVLQESAHQWLRQAGSARHASMPV